MCKKGCCGVCGGLICLCLFLCVCSRKGDVWGARPRPGASGGHCHALGSFRRTAARAPVGFKPNSAGDPLKSFSSLVLFSHLLSRGFEHFANFWKEKDP